MLPYCRAPLSFCSVTHCDLLLYFGQIGLNDDGDDDDDDDS